MKAASAVRGMPLSRPTLNVIIDRVLADLSSRVVGVDGAVLRRSVLGVLGRTLAGASHELHGRLDDIARQVIVDTADAEHLARWSSIWGVRRKPAAFAIGEVVFTGVIGAQVAEDVVLRRQDGVQLRTTVSGAFVAPQLTLPVSAVEAGAAGNTPAQVALTLEQPVSGVQATAIVAASGISAGSDAEDEDALLARLLARLQQPPHGGAAYDYVAWALEVPGVTRAWVAPAEMGLGTVTVRFVRDEDPDFIPDATEVAVVAAYIDARCPVTAEVFVVPPIAVPLPMTITLAPDTLEVREAVTAELRDLLRREALPGGTILLSHLHEAISTAAGEVDHILHAPSANVVHGRGEMPVLGTLTWTTSRT